MRKQEAPLIDINVLPRERRPVEVSTRAMIGAAALAVVLLGVVPLSLSAQHARAQARDAQAQAQAADVELDGLQIDLTRVRALRGEIGTADAERATLEEELRTLQGGNHPLGDDLAALWVPGALGGLRITKVSGIERGLTVEGLAANPLDAIAYASSLTADERFVSARLTSFAPASEGGRFTLEVMR